jgi:hypothetical protein
MTCPHCGGSMFGDGYTTPIHCERLSVLDFLVEPDTKPIFCNPQQEDDQCIGHD